jgi:hypothetical protein
MFEDWQRFHDHLVATAPEQCDTSEKWHQRRGEIAAMRFVLNTGAQVESAMKNLGEQTFPDEPPKEPEGNPLEQ